MCVFGAKQGAMHIQIKTGRVELARKWPGLDLDVYGECRDSEQMLCICEPVGMANCVLA
jgi:hypothetical protein